MNSFGFFVDWQIGIALLWLLYRLVLRGRIPFGGARAYLLLIAPAAATIAFLKLPVLAPIVLQATEAVFETSLTAQAVAVAVETPVDWIWLAYIIVAVGLMLLFVVGAVRWAVRWRGGFECGGVRFCPQGRAVASSQFGRIGVDPCCLGSDALESIVAHERAHVAQRHAWDLLYFNVLRSALWFNPAVWLLGRDLILVHEAQADKAVLEAGFSPEHYIHTLLDAEIGAIGGSIPENLAPIHCFSFCSTKKRIEMMTKLFPSRRSMWRLAAVLPVLGAMLAAFSFTRPVVVEVAPSAERIAIQLTEQPTDNPAVVIVYQKSGSDGSQWLQFFRSMGEVDANKIQTVLVLKGAQAVEYMALDPTSEAGKTVAKQGVVVVDMKGADPTHQTKAVLSKIKDAEYMEPLTRNFLNKIGHPAPTSKAPAGDLNPNDSYAIVVEKPDAAGNMTIVVQKGGELSKNNINPDQIKLITVHKDAASIAQLTGSSTIGANAQEIAKQGLVIVVDMKGADPSHQTKAVLSKIKDAEYMEPLTQNSLNKIGHPARTKPTGYTTVVRSTEKVTERPALVIVSAKTDEGKEVSVEIVGSLKEIDPETIAAVSVLKGSVAADLFWKDAPSEVRALAAEGVVLVTLKKSISSDPSKHSLSIKGLTGKQLLLAKEFARATGQTKVNYSAQ